MPYQVSNDQDKNDIPQECFIKSLIRPQPSAMEPVISIRNLNHFYGTGTLEKQVLFNINLDISAGEIVILTGPSGSGKTTLLTLLGGLRATQNGVLNCLGQTLTGASEDDLVAVRRHIGYIFQAHNLLPFMTAQQNVCMSLEMHPGISRKLAKRKADEVLHQVGLGDRTQYYPKSLSGGQKQRVAIARALASQPKLVLADEPTASLDKTTGRNVVDLMYDLVRQQGCTILLVTHDNRILDIADRIIHMEDGRLITDTPQRTSVAAPTLARAGSQLSGAAPVIAPVTASTTIKNSTSSLIKPTPYSQPSEITSPHPNRLKEVLTETQESFQEKIKSGSSDDLDPFASQMSKPLGKVPLPQIHSSQVAPQEVTHNGAVHNGTVHSGVTDNSTDLKRLPHTSAQIPQSPDLQTFSSPVTHTPLLDLENINLAAYSPQSLLEVGFVPQPVITAPLPYPTQLPASVPVSIPSTSDNRYKVVCIDTDAKFIEAVEQILEKKYFDTIIIDEPGSSLFKVLEHKPDLILLAVNIPEFNAYQLCSLLLKNPLLIETPIIITTNQKRNIISRIRSKFSGASGYLVKPLSQLNLITTIFPHIT